jgi:hypothetical protein
MSEHHSDEASVAIPDSGTTVALVGCHCEFICFAFVSLETEDLLDPDHEGSHDLNRRGRIWLGANDRDRVAGRGHPELRQTGPDSVIYA